METQPTFQGTMHSLKRGATNGQIKYMSCLLFGSAAWKIAPRHDFIGWDADRTRALHNLYFLKEGGLFFSFPIQGSGLSLFSNLSMGEFCPLPASGGISPTDKLRKNSALTPVTSEKSILFSWVTKIVRLCKDLRTKLKLNADCKDFKYKKVFSAALGVNSPP